MGSVYEEITRLETAKADIETAIEGCGVNVPDTDLISTYALYIRQIPSAVFSELNVDPVGGEDMYIKSIELKDGLINATPGGLVSSTSSGIVPKTGTAAAATIATQADEWVLTTTKGGEPTWRKLPANAFKNDNTNTTYSLAGVLSGNTFITTLTDSNSNKTIATIPCVTGASTSAAGKAGLVPAPAKNKLNQYLCSDGSWYDLNVKKYYSIDASELDITKFYPVIIASSNIETDCEVHSPNLSGSSSYNQNVIHFILNALGWKDTPQGFKMIHQGVYSTNEITIGAVGAGNENGSHCVWVRGGLVYRFYCNKEPKLKEKGYTNGNEVYSVGENYSGGTNSKVTIYWTYGDSSQLLAVKGDIPTKTSQLTNNSGFLTSRGYIGGTLVQANQSVQDLVGIKNIIGENSKEIIHATDGYLEFGKGFSDVITWFNASLYKFKLGNTQAFIITTDGKVGIGDVGGAPKAKLHVAGGSVLADSYHAGSGGFSKEGCSDAHILLAGGGHIAVSNFATVSGVSDSLKSYVTLSTNLTITGSKTFTASTNTFSGTGDSILTVDRNSTNPAWIRFCKNGTLQGYIGITNDFQPVFLSGEAGSSNKTLLHAGNYTSYVNTTNFPGLNSVGDITGVTAGNGLTGGATSGTATLNVGAGTGITVNANDIAVKYGNTAGTACQGNDSRLSNARVNPNKLTIFGVEYDGSNEKTVTASTMIATLSEGTSNVTDNTEILTSYASNNGFADSNAPNVLYKRDAVCLYNYINTKLAGAHAGLDKVGTVTSVTVTGANGLSGSGTVTTSGTITLSNAGVRSTTIHGNYLRVNTNGTNANLTIPYATSSHSANTLNRGNLPSSASNKEGTAWCKFATLTFNDSAYSPVSGYLFFSGRENLDFVGILHYHFRASDDKTKLGCASLKWLVNTSLSILVISVKTADNIYDLYVNNYSSWVTPRIHNMITEGSFVWNIGSWTTTKPTVSHTSTLSGRVNYAISASNADTLDGIHASELLTSLVNTNTTANPNSISVTVGGTTKHLKINHAVNSQVLQSVRYDDSDPKPNTTVGVTFQFSNLSEIGWHNVLTMKSYSDNNYTTAQLATPAGNPGTDTGYSGTMKWRQGRLSTWLDWRTILDSTNYTSYVNTTNFPGLNKTGTVTSVTITQGTGITVSNSRTAITTSGTRTISLNSASSSAIGGILLGYSASGANIPLLTSSNKGYVALTKAAVVSALGYTPPTSDTNTTYSAGSGLSLSGTTFSLKTGYTTTGKNYKVQLDSSGNPYVNVPWTDTNTTYSFSNKAATLSWGTTTTIATVGGTNITVKLPANPNTDSLVSQSSTTTSSFRPLVCGYTASSTAGSSMETSVTNVVYVSNKFYAQPSTGYLYATGFSGNLVAGQTYAKTIRPDTTTTHFLGSDAYRWNNIFSNKGNFSGQIISSVATGTSPFKITSTTVNTNLNADMVDGYNIWVGTRGLLPGTKVNNTIYIII